MKKIVLASTSPRRKELLKMIGLKFTIQPSNFQEDMNIKLKPKDLVKFLSLGKAKEVADRNKNCIVIGADTIVLKDDKIIGKPNNPQDAAKILRRLSNTDHQVLTGYTIIDAQTNQIISKTVSAKVYFKKLSDNEIKNYIDSKEPLDKAGAYGIQGLGALLIEKISGDYFTIVGLPLNSLFKDLKKFGVEIL